MNFVAIKMLTGDRAKYLGLIFAIAFAASLLEDGSHHAGCDAVFCHCLRARKDAA